MRPQGHRPRLVSDGPFFRRSEIRGKCLNAPFLHVSVWRPTAVKDQTCGQGVSGGPDGGRSNPFGAPPGAPGPPGTAPKGSDRPLRAPSEPRGPLDNKSGPRLVCSPAQQTRFLGFASEVVPEWVYTAYSGASLTAGQEAHLVIFLLFLALRARYLAAFQGQHLMHPTAVPLHLLQPTPPPGFAAWQRKT